MTNEDNRAWILMGKYLAQEATLKQRIELESLLDKDIQINNAFLHASQVYGIKEKFSVRNCFKEFNKLNQRINQVLQKHR
jgi:hypothetical protein